uniref:Uncharacterized protein n=1 Tax=Romanomermis culicivorax TaxID=13658 RepID=A0A915IS82_ROMCU
MAVEDDDGELRAAAATAALPSSSHFHTYNDERLEHVELTKIIQSTTDYKLHQLSDQLSYCSLEFSFDDQGTGEDVFDEFPPIP